VKAATFIPCQCEQGRGKGRRNREHKPGIAQRRGCNFSLPIVQRPRDVEGVVRLFSGLQQHLFAALSRANRPVR
jgi:hypothetical protein